MVSNHIYNVDLVGEIMLRPAGMELEWIKHEFNEIRT